MNLQKWYGNLNRDMVLSGEMKALIEQHGITGFCAEPSLIERAIGEGTAYDDAICEFSEPNPGLIFDRLMIEDSQIAADLLRSTYEETQGATGYVCVDIPAILQEGAVLQIAEVRRLFKAINRPNLMIKIPGRLTDLTTIEEVLFAGINVNVTMVYSPQNAVSVAGGYIRALERRLIAGLPVDKIASVLTFGLSGVDRLADQMLEGNVRSAQGRADVQRVSLNTRLLGKVGIANAQSTYRRFRDLFQGERFSRLRNAGARLMQLIWADLTPTNPTYGAQYYIDELSAPDVILLVNQATLADHTPEHTIEYHALHTAHEVLHRLEEVGIDLERIGKQLQGDAEDLHTETYRKAIARVEGKRNLLFSGFMRRQSLVLGEPRPAVEAELKRLRLQKSITRMWARDASLWKVPPDKEALVANRLGWLTIASDGRIDRERLRALREESKAAGWKHLVLIGMGGSVITADVLAKTFGPQEGFPRLHLLDTVDPAAICAVEESIDPDKTIFVIASKSGTTLETQALQSYFHTKYSERPFIVITDAGTSLEAWAQAIKCRHMILNPEDMAGAYLALSYFGMVPAALLGLDFERIMQAGTDMQIACANNVMGVNHPGLWLGTIMAVMADYGRNKLTLLTSPELAAIGDWTEQLIAESTGKEGKGVIPVTGATPGMPHDYDDDRLFVYLRLDDSPNNPDDAVRMLREAGNPFVTLDLRDKFDIGAEFFRWQYAACAAAISLGVNPFDEPNMAESQYAALRRLDIYKQSGELPEETPVIVEDAVRLYAADGMAQLLHDLRSQHNYEATPLEGLIAAFVGLARSGQYVALMPYLNPSPENMEIFHELRRRMRHIFKRAVTVGFGPRCLHITGQLDKGGPNLGLYLQFTADDSADLSTPAFPYPFGVLKAANAAGDLEVLAARGRRVIRIHLGSDIRAGLAKVTHALEAVEAKRK